MRHEIVQRNPEAHFFYSVDAGRYVTPHWHNSPEIVYMLDSCLSEKHVEKLFRTYYHASPREIRRQHKLEELHCAMEKEQSLNFTQKT